MVSKLIYLTQLAKYRPPDWNTVDKHKSNTYAPFLNQVHRRHLQCLNKENKEKVFLAVVVVVVILSEN